MLIWDYEGKQNAIAYIKEGVWDQQEKDICYICQTAGCQAGAKEQDNTCGDGTCLNGGDSFSKCHEQDRQQDHGCGNTESSGENIPVKFRRQCDKAADQQCFLPVFHVFPPFSCIS